MRVRKWMKENCAGQYYVTVIKESDGGRRRVIATFVRIKDDDDALLFKLNWAGYE